MERISLNNYFLNIAEVVLTRSTCLKKHYGAVIVKDKFLVSTGYNNPPSGEPHCTICRKTKHGKDLSSYLDCCSTHAEMNAIILASREQMNGAVLYLAGYDVGKQSYFPAKPCEICLRLIKNSGINEVINSEGVLYKRDQGGILRLVEEIDRD